MSKTHLLWEQNDESGDELSACIRGDAPAFLSAASILLSYIQSMPDKAAFDILQRNYERRTPVDITGVMRIATQLGGTKTECCDDSPDLCSVYESAPGLEQLISDYISCFGVSPLSALQYRNKPDDDCQVQVSTDSGVTWSNAWRMDGCTDSDRIVTVWNDQNIYNSYFSTTMNDINNYNNNYVSSIADIYPGLAPDEEEQDFIDNALCHALVRLVDSVCSLSIDYYNNKDEAQAQINLGLALTAAVLTVLSVVGAPFTAGSSLLGLGAAATVWGAAMGLGAALGNALYDRWQENSIEVYEDTAARDTVVCYLNEQFAGQDVTQALFSSALDSYPGTGNALAIAQTVKESIALDQTYAAFAGFASRSLEYAQEHEVFYDDCPCDNSYTWEEVTYVVTGENVEKWTVDSTYGELIEGQYFQSTNHDSGATYYNALVMTRTVDSGCILTYAKVEGEYEAGEIDDTNDSTFYLGWGSYINNIVEPDVPTLPKEISGISANGGAVFFQLLPGAKYGDTPPGGVARLVKLTLRGLGTPPA